MMMKMLMSDNELRYQMSDNELRPLQVLWNVFGGLLEASRGHLGETQNHLKTSPKTPSISDTFISQ